VSVCWVGRLESACSPHQQRPKPIQSPSPSSTDARTLYTSRTGFSAGAVPGSALRRSGPSAPCSRRPPLMTMPPAAPGELITPGAAAAAGAAAVAAAPERSAAAAAAAGDPSTFMNSCGMSATFDSSVSSISKIASCLRRSASWLGVCLSVWGGFGRPRGSNAVPAATSTPLL